MNDFVDTVAVIVEKDVRVLVARAATVSLVPTDGLLERSFIFPQAPE